MFPVDLRFGEVITLLLERGGNSTVGITSPACWPPRTGVPSREELAEYTPLSMLWSPFLSRLVRLSEGDDVLML